MKRSYPVSEETAVDQQRMEFLMKRCGSKPDPTHNHAYHHHHHQGSAHNSCSDQQGETVKNKRTPNLGAAVTTTLSQSYYSERTHDDAVPGAPTGESTVPVAKNVVSSREEHHQLQLKDGSFAINSSLVSPLPRPGNYPSLQGHGGEGEGEGTAVSSLDSGSCQHFAQEPSQNQSKTGSTPSPSCLHVVNHGSLSQGRGEEEASLNCPGGVGDVSHSLSSLETGFKPRDPNDAIRNCSRVNWEVKKVIVDTLTRQLLQTENYITVCQFQDGHTSSSEASISQSLSCEEAPPSVVSAQQQQHVSTTNNTQRQKEEQEGTLSGPSERGSQSHANGAEPELKSRCCNDDELLVCRPHPMATGVEQQQLEGGGGGEEAVGLCEGGDGGDGGEGCEGGDGTPREKVLWNLGGVYVCVCVCECVCVCVYVCMCVCVCV